MCVCVEAAGGATSRDGGWEGTEVGRDWGTREVEGRLGGWGRVHVLSRLQLAENHITTRTCKGRHRAAWTCRHNLGGICSACHCYWVLSS